MQQHSWQWPYQPPARAEPPAPPGGVAGGRLHPGPVSALEALRFTLEHEEWKHNLLMGSLFWLIPIVGPLAVMGWHAETLQRLVRGHLRPVPKIDFSDFGHYLVRGLVPFVVNLIVVLPPVFVGYLIFAVGLGAGLTALGDRSDPTIGIVLLVVSGLVFLCLMLLLTVVGHAAITHAELTEDIGASIGPGRLLAYAGRTWTSTLAAVFVHALLIFPLAVVGYLMCFVGVYPVIHISALALVHLRWQLYGKYIRKGGEPITVKPAVPLPSEAPPMPPYGYGPG